tara:strand:- start:210 stop:416 length:207 start_codon:yes stop_codon:yes gene_type:complete
MTSSWVLALNSAVRIFEGRETKMEWSIDVMVYRTITLPEGELKVPRNASKRSDVNKCVHELQFSGMGS